MLDFMTVSVLANAVFCFVYISLFNWRMKNVSLVQIGVYKGL